MHTNKRALVTSPQTIWGLFSPSVTSPTGHTHANTHTEAASWPCVTVCAIRPTAKQNSIPLFSHLLQTCGSLEPGQKKSLTPRATSGAQSPASHHPHEHLELFVWGPDGIKVKNIFTALWVSLKVEKWSRPCRRKRGMTEDRETAER